MHTHITTNSQHTHIYTNNIHTYFSHSLHPFPNLSTTLLHKLSSISNLILRRSHNLVTEIVWFVYFSLDQCTVIEASFVTHLHTYTKPSRTPKVLTHINVCSSLHLFLSSSLISPFSFICPSYSFSHNIRRTHGDLEQLSKKQSLQHLKGQLLCNTHCWL